VQIACQQALLVARKKEGIKGTKSLPTAFELRIDPNFGCKILID